MASPEQIQRRLKRYSPQLMVFWYTRHLRNIVSASILALAAVLVPEMTGALVHELNVEKLHQTYPETKEYTYAESVAEESEGTIRAMLQDSLNKKETGLRPEEAQFLKDLDTRLK